MEVVGGYITPGTIAYFIKFYKILYKDEDVEVQKMRPLTEGFKTSNAGIATVIPRSEKTFLYGQNTCDRVFLREYLNG